MPGTLAEKVWDAHVVRRAEGEPDLLYIDLHLLHEVTSPQAFDGLSSGRERGPAHQTSASRPRTTTCPPRPAPSPTPCRRTQVETLRRNCEDFGLQALSDGRRSSRASSTWSGPQLGLSQPGMTIVCGDSHTSTHGAFGALAFGIGTSEVEHVLATQTLSPASPFRTMAVTVVGRAPATV